MHVHTHTHTHTHTLMFYLTQDMDEDDDEDDTRSQRSKGGSDAKSLAGRTARASEWGKTAIFSDEGGKEADAK